MITKLSSVSSCLDEIKKRRRVFFRHILDKEGDEKRVDTFVDNFYSKQELEENLNQLQEKDNQLHVFFSVPREVDVKHEQLHRQQNLVCWKTHVSYIKHKNLRSLFLEFYFRLLARDYNNRTLCVTLREKKLIILDLQLVTRKLTRIYLEF